MKLKIITSSEFGSLCLYGLLYLRRQYMWAIQHKQNSLDTCACCCVYAHTDGILSGARVFHSIHTDTNRYGHALDITVHRHIFTNVNRNIYRYTIENVFIRFCEWHFRLSEKVQIFLSSWPSTGHISNTVHPIILEISLYDSLFYGLSNDREFFSKFL